MGIKIEVTAPGIVRIRKVLDRLSRTGMRTILNRGLTHIILEMQSEVTSSGDFIRHGRGDAPALPDILTSRQGGAGLVGSIAPDYTKLPRAVSLGSDLAYAGVHEDSRRAYLLPTYDKMASKGRLVEIMISIARQELAKA